MMQRTEKQTGLVLISLLTLNIRLFNLNKKNGNNK
jgi:hypothetical protein